MNAYGGVDVYIHIFLTSALAGGEWSTSRPGRFITGERSPATHLIGDCVDHRAGQDDLEKIKFLTLSGLELRPPRSFSQSLYRLRYPGPSVYKYLQNIKTIIMYICEFYNNINFNILYKFMTPIFKYRTCFMYDNCKEENKPDILWWWFTAHDNVFLKGNIKNGFKSYCKPFNTFSGRPRVFTIEHIFVEF
jgi:hypothetical protein